MRQREDRQKVMIGARVQLGTAWHDACILNVSTRGMMVQAPHPPPRGEILELRRGRHVIIGRVMWSTRARFGLLAQGRVPVDELVRSDDPAATPPGGKPGERRAAPRRREQDAERSRWRGRALEFGGIAVAGVGAAVGLTMLAGSVFAAPLHAVQAALGGG